MLHIRYLHGPAGQRRGLTSRVTSSELFTEAPPSWVGSSGVQRALLCHLWETGGKPFGMRDVAAQTQCECEGGAVDPDLVPKSNQGAVQAHR